jgi:hypothetical protein
VAGATAAPCRASGPDRRRLRSGRGAGPQKAAAALPRRDLSSRPWG